MITFPNAKINLGLNITEKRPADVVIPVALVLPVPA